MLARLDSVRRRGTCDAVTRAVLIDALDEFSDEVFTQADDQDWGDRIIEQTVTAAPGMGERCRRRSRRATTLPTTRPP